jgi:hypothetical protein
MTRKKWCGHGKYNSATCQDCKNQAAQDAQMLKQMLKNNLLDLVRDYKLRYDRRYDSTYSVSLYQVRQLAEEAGLAFTDKERTLFHPRIETGRKSPFKTLREAVEYYESNVARAPGEIAATNTVEMCYKLREYGCKPYATACLYGFEVEYISFPFPDPRGVSIMLREVGNPATVTQHVFRKNILKAMEYGQA